MAEAGSPRFEFRVQGCVCGVGVHDLVVFDKPPFLELGSNVASHLGHRLLGGLEAPKLNFDCAFWPNRYECTEYSKKKLFRPVNSTIPSARNYTK